MNEEIDKLATQHKVIGVKTDCPHFNNIGNLCSRIENGMVRCDEYLECEFKYIDTLKEENAKLKLDLDLFRKAHNNEQSQRRIFEQRLEKIKEIVKCLKEPMNCDNCNGAGIYECADYECHTYALNKIMNIIEGAKDE